MFIQNLFLKIFKAEQIINLLIISLFLLRELGIGIVPYSPIARGFFASGPELIHNLAEDDWRKVCAKKISNLL